MTKTIRLELPLVMAAQAQKHVTVNEALQRVDALTQLVLISRQVATPPATARDGDCYAVPAGAVNAWAGQTGRIAVYLNGGWDFVAPLVGWRAWIADEGTFAIHGLEDWLAGAQSMSRSGSAFVHRAVEEDVTITAGASVETSALIPANAIVYGVTGLVLSEVTGTLASWQLGTAGGSENRYGSGLGLQEGSWVRGLTSSPLTYYSPTGLTLTAEGGDFAGGVVRLVAHLAELSLPSA